eukprot:4478513-Prymnesium_polylepis.2
MIGTPRAVALDTTAAVIGEVPPYTPWTMKSGQPCVSRTVCIESGPCVRRVMPRRDSADGERTGRRPSERSGECEE